MTSHIYCGGKLSPVDIDDASVAAGAAGIWMTDSDLVAGAIVKRENLLREEPGSESNALSLEQRRCWWRERCICEDCTSSRYLCAQAARKNVSSEGGLLPAAGSNRTNHKMV